MQLDRLLARLQLLDWLSSKVFLFLVLHNRHHRTVTEPTVVSIVESKGSRECEQLDHVVA